MTTTAAPQAIDVPAPAPERAEEAAAPPRRRSRKVLLVVAIIVVAVLAAVLVYVLTTLGKESTDDATVDADVVQLAARVSGQVQTVFIREDQHVSQGQPILKLDDADYAARVQQAQGELSQVLAARAAVLKAQAQATNADIELERARRLRAQGAIPQQHLDSATVAADAAHAALEQAQADLAVVEKSKPAALELAKLDLERTTVVAPGDGRVSSFTAHPGQVLAADQPFAQFVPDHAYVTANFKETQIGAMHPGQRARVSFDAYPHRSFEGRVESLSAGTGAVFSLLPPNNATGNFVKVVQRVPVRVELVNQPADVVLRAGLSADVTVYMRAQPTALP